MPTKPIPDALMFRDLRPNAEWEVRRVAAHRMAAYLDAGWTVLVSTAQIEAADIEETYASEVFKWGIGRRERRA